MGMTRFRYCLRIVLEHEGGKADHKNDRGGRTNFGVTQKVYDDFCKTTGRPMGDVFDIERDEVELIYGGYWKGVKGDQMPEPLDLLMFEPSIPSSCTPIAR